MAQAMTERCYRTKGLPQGFRRVHKDADAPAVRRHFKLHHALISYGGLYEATKENLGGRVAGCGWPTTTAPSGAISRRGANS